MQESFEYDNLDRLTKIQGASSQQMQYANSGNITQKTGMGDFRYHLEKPHALVELSNEAKIPTADQLLTYNSQGKVSRVQELNNRADIQYGYDQMRTQMVYNLSGTLQTITYYKNIEQEQYANGTRTLVYLSSPMAKILVISTSGIVGEGLAQGTYYIHQDHQGSYTAISDQNGTLVQRLSYDAWGRPRNPQNWTYSLTQNPLIRRGYTGHEHLDMFGFINMNGRMYGYSLGRMFSPDNYVQAPDFSQSYNRYAYCWNNPLKYTDPSGESVWDIIADIFWDGSGASKAPTIDEHSTSEYKANIASLAQQATYMTAMVQGAIFGIGAGAILGGLAIPFAKTFAIMGGSLGSSAFQHAYTGGDISMSFGFGSINFSTGEFGYVGKAGNSWQQNLGYGLGAMANLSDINGIFDATKGNLITEVKGDSGIPHSAIQDNNGNNMLSFGPNDNNVPNGYVEYAFKLRNSRSDYGITDEMFKPVSLQLNKHVVNFVASVAEKLPYQGATINCSNVSGLALWLNGIPNISIHPYLLHSSTLLYTTLRPDINSYWLTR